MLEDDRVTNSFIDVSHASSVNRRKPRLTMGLCRDRHESVLHLNKFISVERSFLSSNRLGHHLSFAAILALTSLHSIQSERYLSISMITIEPLRSTSLARAPLLRSKTLSIVGMSSPTNWGFSSCFTVRFQ